MSIIDNCVICGEKISKHSKDSFHGVACLAKLHDLIINYADFQQMLQTISKNKYPLKKRLKPKKDA